MAVRRDAAPELFSSFLAAPPKNEVLRQLAQLIDWESVRRLLLDGYKRSERGQPGFDPVMLFKMLLLEHLYNLSDVAVVEEARDRLSFRQFLCCGSGERIPDDTTLVKFRERLRPHNLLERAHAEIERQMHELGLAVKAGSIKIVDASLIQAAVNKPPARDNADQAEPAKDPDADCTARKGKPFYGFNLHIARDRDSGLITRHQLTPASVADITMFKQMIDGTEKEVLADKGYCSQENRDWLTSQQIVSSILYRAARNRPLTAWQIAYNRIHSARRSFVEGAFANLKRFRRCGRALYIGLLRVRDQMTMGVLVHNLMRYAALSQHRCA